MSTRRLFALPILLALLALVFAQQAAAGGGNYTFDGGTTRERAQVRSALEASSFPWGVVPGPVTIHIPRGIASSESVPGEIWLDANLLDAGTFSWGVVQHEYAHQIDFLLFDDATRAKLNTLLGGASWYYTIPGLQHARYGCERFASTLAWSYWQSPQNSMKPESAADESAAMAPAQFRELIAGLLGVANAGPPTVAGSVRLQSPATTKATPARR
jgi:hypothetical protein